MKDDSAENGMPLAFLISAFCRPLSANARARAIVARIPRHVRSATQNIRGENIHIRSRQRVTSLCAPRSRFLWVPLLFLSHPFLPLPFSFSLTLTLSLTPAARIIRCRNVTRRAPRVITRNTQPELQSHPSFAPSLSRAHVAFASLLAVQLIIVPSQIIKSP